MQWKMGVPLLVLKLQYILLLSVDLWTSHQSRVQRLPHRFMGACPDVLLQALYVLVRI